LLVVTLLVWCLASSLKKEVQRKLTFHPLTPTLSRGRGRKNRFLSFQERVRVRLLDDTFSHLYSENF